jgi:high-affinity Fe2+/Pb2+ permease
MTCSCQKTQPIPPSEALAPAAGVGETIVQAPSSSGPGFLTGLVIGVLAGGALATLLYVGLKDEAQRSRMLAARRRAGYSY